MVINISLQYNGGLLPVIIMLTQGPYHWGTLCILGRFQGTIQAFSEPGQKKQSIERDSEHNKVSLKATLAIRD